MKKTQDRKMNSLLLFFDKFDLLENKKMKINNNIILTNENFAGKKKARIKATKLMTKSSKYLTFSQIFELKEV